MKPGNQSEVVEFPEYELAAFSLRSSLTINKTNE